jgi:antirestriction protein ArdC
MTDAKQDKLSSAQTQLTQAVEALVSSDDWQKMLDLNARFHQYSLRNCMLIGSQFPTASRVAGYQTWKGMGRQVRKGEKGITILAPCVVKKEDEQGEKHSQLVGFRCTHVFDVSQTDGDDLPEVTSSLLEGNDKYDLWDLLAKQVAAAGFQLLRGECDGANGRTTWTERTVTVRADVSQAQAVKTLAHELAHVMLHEGSLACRGSKEIEAESVAYLVCQTAGLTTDEYSFPYIAGWSKGDPKQVQASAETAVKCARQILDEMESVVA